MAWRAAGFRRSIESQLAWGGMGGMHMFHRAHLLSPCFKPALQHDYYAVMLRNVSFACISSTVLLYQHRFCASGLSLCCERCAYVCWLDFPLSAHGSVSIILSRSFRRRPFKT